MIRILSRMKLKTKAALIVGAILVLTVGITSTIQLRVFTAEVKDALQVKTIVLGKQLTREIVKVLEFGLELEDIDDLSQRLQGLVVGRVGDLVVVDDQAARTRVKDALELLVKDHLRQLRLDLLQW